MYIYTFAMAKYKEFYEKTQDVSKIERELGWKFLSMRCIWNGISERSKYFEYTDYNIY